MSKLKENWKKFLETANKQSTDELCFHVSEVIGDAIDPDKPYPEIVDLLCDKVTVSKDRDYFYFKINSARVKQVYAITGNGEVQLIKVSQESLQTLSVSPLNTPVLYMPINDVLSAKGYDAVELMKRDTLSSLDLAEVEKIFDILATCVPAGNKISLASGETRFTYKHLQALRAKVKDYANAFVLLTGSNIDEDILAWDFDDNKYRSVADMVKDLNVTIKYVGHYTLKKDGVDTTVIDSDKAYLVGLKTQLDGKPFVFARKDITKVNFKDVETDEAKQRIVQSIPQFIRDGANRLVAVLGYWGYEEMAVVCRLPLALAEFTRS